MASIERTAYPHFHREPSARELHDLFTAIEAEASFDRSLARSDQHFLKIGTGPFFLSARPTWPCAFNLRASSRHAAIPHVTWGRKPLQDTLQYEMLLRREIRKDQTALVAEGRGYGILLHGSDLNSPHHTRGQRERSETLG